MTSEPSSPTRAPAVEPEKRRLHPAGVLVMVAARAKELFLLLVLAFFDGSRADGLSWFYVASISFVVMLGFVRWYRFRYWFEGDHFRVEDGAIVRKRAFIPLDKVQAVDISAGVTQRLLGLVKLEVKTGAAGTQAELTAITEAEARDHPQRSVVSRALGLTEHPQAKLETETAACQAGDRYLLCSDGLHGFLAPAQLDDLLRNAIDPQSAVDALIAATLAQTEAGDNLTAVCCFVGEPG